MTVSQEVISHCETFKLCAGCPFNGGKCVASVADHKFNDWLSEMEKEIKTLRANNERT